MNEIIPGLWIGNSQDAKNNSELEKNSIRSVFNVAWDLDYRVLPGIIPVKVGLFDGPGNRESTFALAVNTLVALKKMGPVMIHCHEGVSRSPTVAAAYLVENVNGITTLVDAFELIASKRPIINPKKPLIDLATDYLGKR